MTPKFRVFLCMLGVGLLALLSGTAHAESGEERKRARTVSGVVEPLIDVTLGLTVEGSIQRISCKEGETVRKGATLLTLENRLEELEVARRKIIRDSRAELESARAQARTLEKILTANRKLYEETRSVSLEEIQRLTLQWKRAAAEEKLLGIREEREEVEYRMAVQALNRRVLRAPVSGVVEEVFREEGEICESADPLVRIVDAGTCHLAANLEEAFGSLLEPGQEVDLEIHAGGGIVKKDGVITQVSQVVDPASGLMRVKVRFDNRDGRVRPGVSGDLVLPSKE